MRAKKISLNKISILLIFFLSSFQFIKSDIPVHCTSKDVIGKWRFSLYGQFFEQKINDERTTCGHGYPGKIFKDIGNHKFVPENVTKVEEYELKLDFFVYKDGTKVGNWTNVYDQSFLLYIGNIVITANFKYYKDEKTFEYKSDCDRTMTGWYIDYDREKKKTSCFIAEKIEKGKEEKDSETNFLQLKIKSSNKNVQKQKHSKKFVGVDPVQLLKDIKVKDLQKVVDEINRSKLTWKAELNPKFLNHSLEEYSKKHGIYNRRKSIRNQKEKKNKEKNEVEEKTKHKNGYKKKKDQNVLASFLQKKVKKIEKSNKLKKIIIELNKELDDVNNKEWISDIKKQDPKADSNIREKDSKDVTDPKEILKYINTPLEEMDENILPKNWDWRNVGGQNFYSEERMQGNCGSCYAVGSISILESRLRIKTLNKDQTKLSLQFPLSCSYYSEGCNGGYPVLLSKFLNEYEIIPEDCFPYRAQDNNCESVCDFSKYLKKYKLTKYGYLGGYYGAADEVLMMKELRARGPIVGNLIMSELFSLYKGGIFSTKDIIKNAGHFSRTSMVENGIFFEKVEHTTTIVGYGEEDGIKYWIGMNSYGSDWGENGYYKILRGENELNIETLVNFMDIEVEDRFKVKKIRKN